MMGRTPLTEAEEKARAEARKAAETAIPDAIIAASEEEMQRGVPRSLSFSSLRRRHRW